MLNSWALNSGSRAIPIVVRVVGVRFRFEIKWTFGKSKFKLFFLARACVRFKRRIFFIFQLISSQVKFFRNILWAAFYTRVSVSELVWGSRYFNSDKIYQNSDTKALRYSNRSGVLVSKLVQIKFIRL